MTEHDHAPGIAGGGTSKAQRQPVSSWPSSSSEIQGASGSTAPHKRPWKGFIGKAKTSGGLSLLPERIIQAAENKQKQSRERHAAQGEQYGRPQSDTGTPNVLISPFASAPGYDSKPVLGSPQDEPRPPQRNPDQQYLSGWETDADTSMNAVLSSSRRAYLSGGAYVKSEQGLSQSDSPSVKLESELNRGRDSISSSHSSSSSNFVARASLASNDRPNSTELLPDGTRPRNDQSHRSGPSTHLTDAYRDSEDEVSMSEDDSNGERSEYYLQSGNENLHRFKRLEAEYKGKKAAGTLSTEEKVLFDVERRKYVRSLRKRKQDREVGIEELNYAKSAKFFQESRRANVFMKNSYRSRMTELEADADRPKRKRKVSQDQRVSPAGDPMSNENADEDTGAPDEGAFISGFTAIDQAVGKRRRTHAETFDMQPWLPGGMKKSSKEEATNHLNGAEYGDENEGSEASHPVEGIANHIPSRLLASRTPEPAANLPFDSPGHEEAFTKLAAGRLDTRTAKGSIVLSSGITKAERRRRNAADKQKIIAARDSFTRGNLPPKKSDREGKYKLPRMKYPLKPHQVLGASWMRDREKSADEPFGGICADAPGLGKTVMMLANITDDHKSMQEAKKAGHGGTLVVLPPTLLTQWQQEIPKHCVSKFCGVVYIYAASQFKYAFSDPLGELKKADIVLTTYNEVSNSYPPKGIPDDLEGEAKAKYWEEYFEKTKGPLHQIHWHRVAFDEADKVKNCETRAFRAAKSLLATHRWVMTGTPLTDKILELFSYCKIIHLPMTGHLKTFRKNYCSQTDTDHTERLSYTLRPYIIQRDGSEELFGQRIQDVPSALEVDLWVPQSDFEHALHTAIVVRYGEEISNIQVITQEDATRRQILILNMVNSLRLLALHPLLVQSEFAKLDDATLEKLEAAYEKSMDCDNRKDRMKLQQALDIPITQEHGQNYGMYPPLSRYLAVLGQYKTQESLSKRNCDSCRTSRVVSKAAPCGHFFCETCNGDLKLMIAAKRGRCLCCRLPVEKLVLHTDDEFQADEDLTLEATAARSEEAASKIDAKYRWTREDKGMVMPSTKIMAVKLKILDWLEKDQSTKIIVFTQSQEIIFHLKQMCKFERWNCVEVHGETTKNQRDKAIEKFKVDKTVNILFSTVKTGGFGLNLTVASKAILVEPWWNSAVEEQAFGRLRRYGQTENCELVRILLEGSIDDRMLDVQGSKAAHFAKIDFKAESVNRTYKEFLRLFGPRDKKQGRAYIYDDDTAVPAGYLNEEEDDDSSVSSSGSESEAEESQDFIDEEIQRTVNNTHQRHRR